jgi:HAD superfamily hydrolase (TIGR01509 family)
MLKAVIFDLDGTLIDSKIDFQKMKRRSIRLLEASGVKQGLLTENMLNYDIEARAKEYLRKKGAPEEAIQMAFQKVTKIMNQIELKAVESVRPVDGVVKTLVNLKARGLKIGIITRSCREYTHRILEKLDLKRFIDAIAARDDVSKPKPAPEHPQYLMTILRVKPSETILVGDHPMDALCARNAGIRYFLVPGRNANARFRKNDNKILQSIKDLIPKLS